jgi:drug/metabolite transporter (DMT)-like permease
MKALIAGLVTVTLWGSAFVGIRAASLPPGPLALGRLLVALVVLGVAMLIRREPRPALRDLPRILAFGVLFLAVYSVTLNVAEQRVDAGTAAMVINTGPILITILAGVFLKEGFPPGLLFGCVLAFAGCVLIGLSGSRSGSLGGILLLVVAAVAYASAVVIQKPALARVSPLSVTWYGCAFATVVCLPFGPALVRSLSPFDVSAVGWTLYLGLGPTALGFATWAYALRHSTAGRLAALAYLIPVVAILLGWVMLGQVPARLALAGGALCLVGVVLARRRPGATASGR